jgi:hypothetical protein
LRDGLLRALAEMIAVALHWRLAARLFGACLAAALLTRPVHAASPAQAGQAAASTPLPARVRLDYTRDPSAHSCVSAEQLAGDVETRLGRPVFVGAEPADLVARVAARRVQGRFIVEVELRDRAGRRLGQRQLSTRAAHCSSLDDSLALVLALAADAPRAEPESPAPAEAAESPAPEPVVRAPSGSLQTPIAIPANTHAARLGWRWAPSAGVALASGLFPSAAFGIELGVELHPPHFWPVSLRGTWWVEQSVGGRPRPGRGIELAARTLELGLCPWVSPLASFEAAACFVQWLGRVDARGSGFDENAADEAWIAAVGLAPRLAHRFGPLTVSATGALLVPLVRRRYFSSDATDITLHEQPALFGAAALRVAAEF